MIEPHPLNQAVIAQVLYDLRNGRWRRCLSMGFGERELEKLSQPDVAAQLLHAQVPWCAVFLNVELFWRLVDRLQDIKQGL